jgi:iron complex transport system ATP-binding protein
MSGLQAQQLQHAYEERQIIRDLNLSIPPGKITALVGPNGCGKSTILKALARLLKPTQGQVYLDGKAIQSLPTKEVARRLAILPQSPIAPDGLTVEGLVRLGRYPYQSLWGKQTQADDEMVQWALQVTSLEEWRHHPLNVLSGGQRQRVWIAMALAQGTELLLLDEPTTYLDIAYQLEVLELLQRLNRLEKKTVVMVVHDLNHAARYAHYLVAIHDGQIVAEGPPEQVLTPQLLVDVFAVKGHVYREERTGVPFCVPYECIGNCETIFCKRGVGCDDRDQTNACRRGADRNGFPRI